MRLLFNVKNQGLLNIQLVKNKSVLARSNLTITKDFDILLIKSIDKLIHEYKIGKLSLKNVEIREKIRQETVSGMVLQTVAKALSM